MNKRLIRITIAILLSAGIYLLISFILLDGKITYGTSSYRFTLQDSKADNYFATDDLKVITRGDSLKNWRTKFDIWTNFRSETKYFGVLFHWTFYDPDWRCLNLDPKTDYVNRKWFRSKLIVNGRVYDYMKSFSGGWEPCFTPIGCNVGDTVTIEFTHAVPRDSTLGSITVVVK